MCPWFLQETGFSLFAFLVQAVGFNSIAARKHGKPGRMPCDLKRRARKGLEVSKVILPRRWSRQCRGDTVCTSAQGFCQALVMFEFLHLDLVQAHSFNGGFLSAKQFCQGSAGSRCLQVTSARIISTASLITHVKQGRSHARNILCMCRDSYSFVGRGFLGVLGPKHTVIG